jgi:hypothetical protein
VRLLDQIAQTNQPLIVRQTCGTLWKLPSPCDFAGQLAQCPLRYVLSDELVRLCAELAYAEGDEVGGCLDLMHVPAAQLWIEWDDAVLRARVSQLLNVCPAADDSGRGGALVIAPGRGRSATIRSFWNTRTEPHQVFVSAAEAILDLDQPIPGGSLEGAFSGTTITVRDPQSSSVDKILSHAGFRLDPAWQRYYAATATSPALRSQVIHGCLSGLSFDIPMLTALFLLLSLRVELPRKHISVERINRKRALRAKRPLLEHIELSCPLFRQPPSPNSLHQELSRRPSRLHHVRGHLVRRHATVFWRSPHWRGHIRLGSVRSRTVDLTLR